MMLVNGDVLSGRLESIEHGVLRMKPLAAGEAAATLDIPLAMLATVEIKNGRLTPGSAILYRPRCLRSRISIGSCRFARIKA